MVLYADVLFLIDFSMDVLTLWAAGRLTHSKLRAFRISIAAAFGSVTSVIVTAIGVSRIVGLILGCVTSLIMSFIAFGKGSVLLIIRRYIILWLGGILLGGIMTAVMSAGKLNFYTGAENTESIAVAVIPAGALLLFVMVSALIRSPKTSFAEITIFHLGKSSVLRAICDSGNMLVDPFSGETVIFVSAVAAKTIFDVDEIAYLVSKRNDPPKSLCGRIRLIPASSLGGESLLKGVRADKIFVGDKLCSAVVAVTDRIHSESYNAVISTKLL